MHPFGALLIPELRWDRDHGFSHQQGLIDDALELGVGGFVIANGPVDRVATLAASLQQASRHPLVIAANAERGASAALDGGTGLPPFAALGALRDEDVLRRAARLTARELRGAGVTWALAPCADLAIDAANPFIGARALHHDPQRVAEWVVAWVDACQAEGVLATAMHLPGEGRAPTDPALGPSVVDTAGAALWGSDLVPFRAAVDAGVATVLVSAVSYPRLDATGAPAARSRVILRELMREELQFEGLLVGPPPTTAALRDAPEGAVVSAMLAAGCDLVLAPHDVVGAYEAITQGLDDGRLRWEELEASVERRAFWAGWGRGGAVREPTLEDVLWARKVSDTVVHAPRGVFANIGPVVDVILVDDDAPGAPADAARFTPFLATLQAVGMGPRVVSGPTDEGRGAVCIAVRGAAAPGRGRAGYHALTRARIAEIVASARAARRSVVAVLFGPPALAEELPEVPNVIAAWSGDRAMQEAAARRLA